MNTLCLLSGLILALFISGAAYAAGSLASSGMLASVLVGTLTFGIGGLAPAALLILFFISSSLLSRIGGQRKRKLQSAFAKGGRRDLGPYSKGCKRALRSGASTLCWECGATAMKTIKCSLTSFGVWAC